MSVRLSVSRLLRSSHRAERAPEPALDDMGCGLRKLEDPEDSSPGKIYSTLKRPQVETKTETVFEYVLLDFSLEGESVIDPLHVLSINALNSVQCD